MQWLYGGVIYKCRARTYCDSRTKNLGSLAPTATREPKIWGQLKNIRRNWSSNVSVYDMFAAIELQNWESLQCLICI